MKWLVIGQFETVARKGDGGPVPSRQAAKKTVIQRDIEEDARRSPALPLRPFSCTFGTALTERECFVYIAPPGATEFVTAGRFQWTDDGDGTVGRFVYGRSYRERADAVELGPVELRLSGEVYETARMQGFFGAIRDSMPDFWGRRVIERNAGFSELTEFDYLMQGPDDRAGAPTCARDWTPIRQDSTEPDGGDPVPSRRVTDDSRPRDSRRECPQAEAAEAWVLLQARSARPRGRGSRRAPG